MRPRVRRHSHKVHLSRRFKLGCSALVRGIPSLLVVAPTLSPSATGPPAVRLVNLSSFARIAETLSCGTAGPRVHYLLQIVVTSVLKVLLFKIWRSNFRSAY